MVGTWTYNSTTNVLTVTGGTSGSPAGFVDAWNADKAGTRTLKAATASPFTASLDTVVKPADSLALKLSAVITNFSVAGTITLTGKDAWGNAISEVLNVTGNGTVVSTLYYASIDSNGLVAAGTFTVAIIQPRWGIVWKNLGNPASGTWPVMAQYRFECALQTGDGSASTYFADNSQQILFVVNATNVWTNLANSTVVLGVLVDAAKKATDKGVIISLYDTTSGASLYYNNGGVFYLYSCSSVYLGNHVNVGATLGNIARIWNCRFENWRGVGANSSGIDFYNVNITGFGDSYLGQLGIDQQCNNATVDTVFITGVNWAIWPFGTTSMTVRNVVASKIRTAFIYANVGANEYFVDCTFLDSADWSIQWNAWINNGRIYRQYSLDLTTDPSATVTLKDNVGNSVFSVFADATTGAIPTQTVSRGYYIQPTGNTLNDFGPFTLTITKPGKMPYTQTGIVLTEKTKLLVVLRDQLTGDATTADVVKNKTFYAADADSQLIGAATLKGHTKILTKIVEKEKEVRLPSALEAPALELVENLLQQNIDRKKRQKS
jgi:hypothetical protein